MVKQKEERPTTSSCEGGSVPLREACKNGEKSWTC